MTDLDGDTIDAVLVEAESAVAALSPKARQRLAEGAEWVRVPAFHAKRLIAAVDAYNADIHDGED